MVHQAQLDTELCLHTMMLGCSVRRLAHTTGSGHMCRRITGGILDWFIMAGQEHCTDIVGIRMGCLHGASGSYRKLSLLQARAPRMSWSSSHGSLDVR